MLFFNVFIGKLAEYDTPKALLANEDSIFSSLAAAHDTESTPDADQQVVGGWSKTKSWKVKIKVSNIKWMMSICSY